MNKERKKQTNKQIGNKKWTTYVTYQYFVLRHCVEWSSAVHIRVNSSSSWILFLYWWSHFIVPSIGHCRCNKYLWKLSNKIYRNLSCTSVAWCVSCKTSLNLIEMDFQTIYSKLFSQKAWSISHHFYFCSCQVQNQQSWKKVLTQIPDLGETVTPAFPNVDWSHGVSNQYQIP